jgi:hypothetical protein
MDKSKFSKKSAIPEYIWYISLIVISLSLVLMVVNIAKKSRKNPSIPEIRDATFTIYVDPLNRIYLEDMLIQGVKKEDLANFYIGCNGNNVDFTTFFNQSPSKLFATNSNNYLELIRKNFEINLTAINISDDCKKEGSEWYLFYGNPEEGGSIVAKTNVERKVRFG